MAQNHDFHTYYQYIRIPDLIGRPQREDPIGHDDELNLQIALALSKDVLDFLEDHHIFKG